MCPTSNPCCTRTASSRRPRRSSRRRTLRKADADALYAEAERDFEGFWARLARENLAWHKPFTQALDESNAPFYKWFHDGELNASYNCLDRNLERGLGDKVAIIFEADDGKVTKVTYRELHRARVQARERAEVARRRRRATAS